MTTLLIALGSMVLYLVAYHTYGRFLARKIFRLDPDAPVPSIQLNDDRDYVPTSKSIVFGHHFTSIAGTGPIVGPAIAVMWGWLPALLWVLLGSILIGAVHDFGALVVSLRNRGQTVGDIAGRMLNRRVRLLFLFVLFMALTIVLAIFGLVIAAVFKQFPAAIFPCVVQIPIAVGIGVWLHRKGVNLLVPSLMALGVMYLTVVFGDWGPLHAFNTALGGDPTDPNVNGWPIIAWVVVLLIYSYVASVLPVWTLLQPRDYINSLQLLTALGLVVVGLVTAALLGGAPPVEGAAGQPLELVAPTVRWNPEGAPYIIPFLFITIACGAISGFHCLVSSGTSSKQLKCETDAQFVGYGSMLTEGFLATLVILACVAGLGLGIPGPGGEGVLVGAEAYEARYATWQSAGGLSAKVGAFVDGSANFLKAMGIAPAIAVALMGVLVASFAGTTLDTACRLQRYVVQELALTFAPRVSTTANAADGYDTEFNEEGVSVGGEAADHRPHRLNPLVWLTNKHGATIFAVVVAAAIAALPKPGADWTIQTSGTGGLILWPLFGATNQLLAGLAFMVIFFYLWRRRLPLWFIALPMVFMLVMPAWAMLAELPGWLNPTGPAGEPLPRNWAVIIIATATVALEAWMVIEAILLWPRVKGVLEDRLPPLAPAMAAEPQHQGGRSC
ncbi:MAG: carbon starvation protein A [Phycisphaerae bacterium]|nr:carbon starvation protein A [Phycisphaerae bacterium]